MPSQNTGLTSPASIAPGMAAITALSTISIVAIDNVSAATTTPSAAPQAESGVEQRQRRQREPEDERQSHRERDREAGGRSRRRCRSASRGSPRWRSR